MRIVKSFGEKRIDLEGNILLLASESDIKTGFKEGLIEHGVKVEHVLDCSTAKTVIDKDPPNLFLLSSAGAISAKFALCRYLKSSPLTRHIPIIVIGREPKEGEIVQWLDTGVNDFISMSSDPIEWLLRIKNLIRLSQTNREFPNEKVRQSFLDENEQQYKRLYLNAGIGALYLSNEGIIKEVNEIALKRLPMAKAEILGHSIFELFPKEADHIKKRIVIALASESSQKYEDHIELDGETYWFLIVYSKFQSEREGEVGLQIMTIDITKEKSHQLRLQQTEAIHTSAVSAISEGFVVQDTSDRILAANQAAADILGLSMNQLLSKESYDPLWKATHEDGTPFRSEDHPSVITCKTGKAVDKVIMKVHTADSQKFVAINSRPIFKEGELKGAVVTFLDITEQKLAEKAIKASEGRFAQAFEYSPIPVSIIDVSQGKRIAVNNSFCETFGYSKDELLNETDHSQNNIRVRLSEFNTAVESLNYQDGLTEFPFSMYTKSGEIRKVLLNATKLYPDNEDVFITSYLDITEQEIAKAKLKNSEEHLRAIVENSLNAIVVADDLGNYISVNQAAADMFGYSEEQLLSMNVSDLRSDIASDVAERYGKYVEQGQEVGEFEFLNRNQQARIAQYHSVRVRENFNLSILSDITDAKQAEMGLVASEEQFKKLSNLTFEGIFIHKDGIIQDHNLSIAKMFGYDGEDLTGHNALLLFTPPSQRPLIQSKIASKYSLPYESIGLRKDGTEFPIEIEGRTFMDEKSEVVRVTAIRDITDKKIAERKLKESEERFANAFNHSPIALSILNINTGQRIAVNHVFCDLFGFSKQDSMDLQIHKNPLAVEPQRLKAAIELARETGVVNNFSLDMRDVSGAIKNILISATKIMSYDDEIFIVSYLDITQRIQAQKRVKKAEAEIYKAMVNSEEKERARYAKELHDGLGPILSTSMIYLHSLLEESIDEKQTDYLKRTYALLEDATQSIREISNNLSPDILRRYGVVQAVRSFIEKLKLISNINFEIYTNLKNRLPEVIEFTIYRTLIELINNSIKHAAATNINIRFNFLAKQIVVKYVEDGKGFDYQDINYKGFGLMNIKSRIKKIGGYCNIDSAPGEGLYVEIGIQIQNDD